MANKVADPLGSGTLGGSLGARGAEGVPRRVMVDGTEVGSLGGEPQRSGGAAPMAAANAWRVLRLLARRPSPDLWQRLDREAVQAVWVLDVDGLRRDGTVEIELRQRTRAGAAWGPPRPVPLTADLVAETPDAEDRLVLGMLLGNAPPPPAEAPAGRPAGGGRFRLADPVVPFVLPRMAATGRLLAWRDGACREPSLRWDDDPQPWVLGLRVGLGGGVAEVQGFLQRGRRRIALARVDGVARAGVVLRGQMLAPADLREAFPVVQVLTSERIAVPAHEVDRLVGQVLALPGSPLLELPERWDVAPQPVRPTEILRLSTSKARESGRVAAALWFDYAGERIDAADPATVIRIQGARRALPRDLSAERRAARELLDLGLVQEPPWSRGTAPLSLAPDRMPEVVRALLDRGWQIEADGAPLRAPRELSLSVVTRRDWFELQGGARFGDELVPLPALLASLRAGAESVTLDGGGIGLLPNEWQDRLATLLRLARVDGGAVRMPRSQAWLLDALVLAEPQVSIDAGFARVRERLAAFRGVQPRREPATFRGTLRGYQRDALGWFAALRDLELGGCLADDMGLGKTVQVLAMLEERRTAGHRPSLVVTPPALSWSWRAEARRFAPAMRVLRYGGPRRDALLARMADADLVLTTYGVLRKDAPRLAEVDFDYVVLDEAHTIKNPGSQAAKAARLLRPTHRLALTGTPIENALSDLWSLFEFVTPGLLGGSRPHDVSGGDAAEQVRNVVGEAVRPFLLRRTKDQVVRDLPPKTEQVLWCAMGAEQRRLYDELKSYYRDALLAGRGGTAPGRMAVLEALLRLRQAACHPGLLDVSRRRQPSAKVDLLLQRLTELAGEGHKALVFSSFTSLLDLVGERLHEVGNEFETLDGRTKDRQQRVERFQGDAGCSVFLVSLKAGGVGLTLTAADYVFLLDPWWNPAAEAQAIDRAHRIGQQRPVFAYRMLCRGTVEEKIAAMQTDKRELADAVVQPDRDVLGKLTRRQLERLLG